MKTYQTESFVEGYVFLEGPRWHAGRLWTSDIHAQKVYAIAPDGAAELMAEVANRPSGLGFMPDDTPLIVSMHDRCVYKLINGKLQLHADVSGSVTGDINDMVVDAKGRAYIGSMGYDFFAGETAKPGDIVLVHPDGGHEIAARELNFPNGLVIKDNGTTLVVAESFGEQLRAFDRAPDGRLSNPRIYAEMKDLVPDGMCLDTAGNIWVAGATAGEFVQVDPAGRIIANIDVKPHMAIACQLGGDDGHTLFCLIYAGGIPELSAGIPGARIVTARVTAAAAGSP